MTLDPERLTALVWRLVAGAVVGWVCTAGVVGWLAFRAGYAAGFEAYAGLTWG